MVNFRDFVTSGKAKEPHYLVIGHPVGHSLSPRMHRKALRHHRLDGDYLAVDLFPGDLTRFTSWINRDEFLGSNITIPYKREFLSVVDRLDKTAKAAGAINTIVKREGELVGYNTDVDGFRLPLESWRDQLEGESVIVFGSGGASRAVNHALGQLGAGQIIVVSRNPENLEASDFIPCNYQNWQAFAEEAVLLVNSTPLGMYPDISTSPVEDRDVHLLKDRICYDLVYNPLQTKFLDQANQAGARETIRGLDMFVSQGGRSFELWTGKRFPEEIMKFMETELS
ncbi:MAG: shikimate dehydrogenase, partial [Balneolaceae bacterium]